MSSTADNTRTWSRTLLLVVLALSILKGLRMPNRWSVTQYLFGYDFGFIPRGLFGEILSVFGSWTRKYLVLAMLAMLVAGTLIWLLARLAVRLPEVIDRAGVTLVVLASPAIAMMAHLAGYLEQLGYLCVLALVLLQRRWTVQLTAAIAVAVALPFVHEASIVWVGPLTLLAVVVLPAGSPPPAVATRMRAMALLAGLWVLSTALVVVLGSRTTSTQVEALRADRTASFDIRPRQDAFSPLAGRISRSVEEMRRRWSDPATQLDMALSVATFGPATALLALVAIRRARTFADRATKEVGVILTLFAIASPLLLHAIGWDLHRWNALAALNAGVAALMLLGVRAAAVPISGIAKPVGLTAGLAVAIWSIAADPVFFDGYGAAHPPFLWHITFLRDFFRTWDWSMWIPVVGN
jgi:hypothetical protein